MSHLLVFCLKKGKFNIATFYGSAFVKIAETWRSGADKSRAGTSSMEACHMYLVARWCHPPGSKHVEPNLYWYSP